MRTEKLTKEQMEILLDFAYRSRHLCFGRAPTGVDADIAAFREWNELSRNLNNTGYLPWKSGKEWKTYWHYLKTRTKSKVAHARRRARLTGGPLKLNLNCWEQRIIELAEIAAKEPKRDKYNGRSDTTASLSDETGMAYEPKFESTPNTSQMMPLDMSNGSQSQSVHCQQYINETQGQPVHCRQYINVMQTQPVHSPQYIANGTQTNFNAMIKTPAAKKGYSPLDGNQRDPRVVLSQAQPPPPNQASAPPSLSPLAEAVRALARANMSIADALRGLGNQVSHH